MAYGLGERKRDAEALKIKKKETPKKKKKKKGGGINRAAMQRIAEEDNQPYNPKASY